MTENLTDTLAIYIFVVRISNGKHTRLQLMQVSMVSLLVFTKKALSLKSTFLIFNSCIWISATVF